MSINLVTTVKSDGGSDTTASLTIAAGVKVLVVAVNYDKGDGTTVLTSITWNSNPMTILFHTVEGVQALATAYMFNPEVGTFNVTAGYNQAIGVNQVMAATFSGSVNTTTIGGSNSNQASGSPDNISVTVTVQGARGLIVQSFGGSRVASSTFGAGQTSIENWVYSGALEYNAAMSYEAHTGSNVTVEQENMTGISSNTRKHIHALELLPSAFVPHVQLV